MKRLLFIGLLLCSIISFSQSTGYTHNPIDSSLKLHKDHLLHIYPVVEKRTFDSVTKETEGVMKCTDKTGLPTFIAGYRVEVIVKYLYVIRFYDSTTHEQVGVQGSHKAADNLPKFHTEYHYFNRKHEKLSSKWKVISFSKSD